MKLWTTTTRTTTSHFPHECPFSLSRLVETASAVDVVMDVDSVSAARRRRERRLRQFLRCEHLSVAMALSEKKHHTSRGQSQDIARRWVRDALHGQVPGQPTTQPELFQLYQEEPGGSWPQKKVGEPRGAQEKAQQRTVEQPAVVAPMVQFLDTPVPQMVDQLMALSVSRRRRNSWWKRQLSCISLRSSSRPLTFQLALVVVLATEVSKVFSQDRVLLRLPSRPVLRRDFSGGLQGLHPGQSSTAVSEQNVDIPDLRGGLQGFFFFNQMRVPQRFFQIHKEKHFLGFSPREKKVRGSPRTRGRNWMRTQLIHAGSSAAVHATILGKGLLGGW